MPALMVSDKPGALHTTWGKTLATYSRTALGLPRNDIYERYYRADEVVNNIFPAWLQKDQSEALSQTICWTLARGVIVTI